LDVAPTPTINLNASEWITNSKPPQLGGLFFLFHLACWTWILKAYAHLPSPMFAQLPLYYHLSSPLGIILLSHCPN
jgi:hypothetical protein